MTIEEKAEFTTAIDQSIKANLAEIAGKEIAEKVDAKVAELRLEKALGNDIIGLTNDDKKAFANDIKSIATGQKAAYLESSDQAGGYLVPTELHEGIQRIAATTGIVARDASKFNMNSDTLDIPRYTGSVMQGEYIGEDDEGEETQNDFGNARLSAKQWMTIFRLSNSLLADADVKLAEWLISMAGEGLAYRLDREGFVGGTFAGSPYVGLLASADVAAQTLGSGATGFEDFSLAEASRAIAALPPSVLNGAAFYFHRTVWGEIRARKGTDVYEYGNSGLATFQKEDGIKPVGMLLEYPVYTTDVLPAYSASAISTKFGVFGNLKQALYVGDRGPMQIANSQDATVGGKSLFRANQTGIRLTHRHAVTVGLGAAAVALKTAAG
jgi:HK97 family phage major capsid protein